MSILIHDLEILSSFRGRIRLDGGRLLASWGVLGFMCLGSIGKFRGRLCLT